VIDPRKPTTPDRHRFHCPCGEPLSGPTEDDLVRTAYAHLSSVHPELVGKYSREDILMLAAFESS
jgi:hypothetical protein